MQNVPSEINFISYHQEFSLQTFHKGEPHQNRNAYSFVHCLKAYPDWSLFQELEKALPEYNFKSFGAGCRDDGIHGRSVVADKMREAQWIVHFKWSGDGFGHVIFNSFAVGRPAIIKAEYYKNKLAEPLLLDGETCIKVDGRSTGEVAEMIREYSKPEKYTKMVNRCRERFDEIVDYDEEAGELTNFLNNLK